jgi:predicted aspartyl protease
MENLVIVSPDLYLRGAMVETEIYPSEIIFLEHKNRLSRRPMLKVNMLLDTGSNISGLDRSLIDQLQLPLYTEKACVDGAGGLISLNLYRCVLYLDIFNQKALPLDIVEGNFDDTPYQGVIGRDVLQYCLMQYDGPSNSFRLSAPGF